MKLFGSKNSRSLRCVWALEEANASYDYQRVWMTKGDGKKPEFKAVNPAGKIPVLQDGALTLTESVAIIFYIADKFPQAGLIPSEPTARAEMYRWIFFAVSEIEPHLWAIAQHRFALPEDKRVPALEPTAAWQLARALRAIETRLTHAPFLAGDMFSLADILCFHCLTWTLSAKLEGVGEASLGYVERLRARPALVRANVRERIEAEQHEARIAATNA